MSQLPVGMNEDDLKTLQWATRHLEHLHLGIIDQRLKVPLLPHREPVINPFPDISSGADAVLSLQNHTSKQHRPL